MDLELAGRVAIVGGASQGIGRATALTLAAEGCHVVMAARREDVLREAAAEAEKTGAQVLAVPADLTSAQDAERLVAAAVERFGRVDICVNNAGIGNPPAPLVSMTDEGFDRTVAVNLRGVFLCMRAAGRQMLQQGDGGRIISVASQAGKTGFAMLGPYCATKAGVILISKAMAKEVGASKITVNVVCPGTIDTPLLRGTLDPILEAQDVTLEEWALKNGPPIALNRIGYPRDVANLITFLASDDADYMTGQAINISGGQEMH